MSNKSMDTAKKYIDETTQEQIKEAGAFIDDVISEIAEPAVKIPEPVFRELFYPYITGQKEITPQTKVVEQWMGIVGPTEPADIVDVKGEVLFSVPPMIDTDLINKSVKDKFSLKKIVQEYMDDSMIHQTRADGMLRAAFSQRLKSIVTDKNEAAWQPMLKYYSGSADGSKAPSTHNNTDDGFEVIE